MMLNNLSRTILPRASSKEISAILNGFLFSRNFKFLIVDFVEASASANNDLSLFCSL